VLSTSWIPAAMLVAAAVLMLLYPLTEEKMVEIERDLKARRGEAA
jgi:Na+/melibiose symporter-like transporter